MKEHVYVKNVIAQIHANLKIVPEIVIKNAN